MPAVQSIFHRALRKVRGISTQASRSNYASDNPSKSGYLRHGSSQDRKSGGLPFVVISKSTQVDIYRTERSDSDIELVDGPK
jgi:hypothetical protein